MTTALVISIAVVSAIGLACLADAARLTTELDAMQADYEDALEVNQILVKALAQQVTTTTDTRVVLDLVSSALGHSLNGDDDSAYAILGELGDTHR